MRFAALGLICATACTASPSRSATAPAPPDDIAYLLAIVVGDEVTASALVPREVDDDVGAALPETFAQGEEAWILGFTQAELDRIPWTPTEGVARPAGPADFVLPAPAWRVRGSIEGGDARLALDDGVPPEVTVPGLPACPDLYGEDAFADVRCRPGACLARIEQRGCVVQLDATWCELDMRGTLDGRGNPVFTSQCEVLPNRPGARSVVECPDISDTRCQVHLYDRVEPIDGQVTRRAVYDVEPTYFDDSAYEDFGLLTGLAVLDDRVVVVGHGGRPSQVPCFDRPSDFIFLDPGDLTVIGTSSTSHCVRDVVASSDRTSFYAIFGSNGAMHFGHFDRDANLIASEPLLSPPAEYRRIVLHAEGRRASFVELRSGTRAEWLVTVDLDDLTITASQLFEDVRPRPYDLAAFFGALLIVDRELNRVILYDSETRQERSEFLLCDNAVHPESIFTDGRTVFALGTHDDSVLVSIDIPSNGTQCETAKPFVEHFDTREVVGKVGDSVVVIGRTRDPLDDSVFGRAVVSTYLPERNAFVPGTLDIGAGQPRHSRLVDGVLYATLPFTAEVVRVLLAD